jgi:hypothetical protein
VNATDLGAIAGVVTAVTGLLAAIAYLVRTLQGVQKQVKEVHEVVVNGGPKASAPPSGGSA